MRVPLWLFLKFLVSDVDWDNLFLPRQEKNVSSVLSRKHLLQTMAVHSHGAMKVEELKDIEDQILKIRQQVQNPSTVAAAELTSGEWQWHETSAR